MLIKATQAAVLNLVSRYSDSGSRRVVYVVTGGFVTKAAIPTQHMVFQFKAPNCTDDGSLTEPQFTALFPNSTKVCDVTVT